MANRKSDHSPLLDHEDAADGAFRLPDVEPLVENLLRRLREVNGVRRAVAVGDYRRRKETLDRLDILVACDEDSPVMDRFVNDDGIAEVLARGKTHSSACSDDGMPIDLRIIPEDDFGLALHHFTGSADHIGVLRNVDVLHEEPRFATRTEEEVYEALGLPFIPPELRENRGEIEAARNGDLPNLIAIDDIRGDLHSHTSATDGRSTLEEMAAAAQSHGYEYLAVTDHSTYAMGERGMNESRLRRQMERIDELNEQFDGFRLLKGLETDIRKDGSLDMSDAVLAELDIVVCSLHAHLNLPEAKQTARVIRAMDNPHFNIYAHPTAKLAGVLRCDPNRSRTSSGSSLGARLLPGTQLQAGTPGPERRLVQTGQGDGRETGRLHRRPRDASARVCPFWHRPGPTGVAGGGGRPEYAELERFAAIALPRLIIRVPVRRISFSHDHFAATIRKTAIFRSMAQYLRGIIVSYPGRRKRSRRLIRRLRDTAAGFDPKSEVIFET